MAKTKTDRADFTVPGVSTQKGHALASKLQMRLHALNDLALTLKQAHWNVTGRGFIGVHEMLDPQIDAVRAMVDETAERMATMGVAPLGTPGAIVADRTWVDYAIGRGDVFEHLAALDLVYTGVIEDHRKVIEEASEVDPITEDMLISQVAQLEQFQWFIRAHLENSDGALVHDGADTERSAASKAKPKNTKK